MSRLWGWFLTAATLAAIAPAARAEEPAAEAPATDHARVVGSVGLGWFGVSEIPLGALDEVIAAPAIGARWWIADRVGVDLGLGLAIIGAENSASTDGMTVLDQNGPASTAVLIHLGVPIALYAGRHYTLLAVPEANIGFASSEITSDQAGDAEGPVTTARDGSRFDIGGRMGAEIHFGFIGIPELALEASVGLFFTHLSASRETGASQTAASSNQLSTASFNDPWDFFRSAVAARYYF